MKQNRNDIQNEYRSENKDQFTPLTKDSYTFWLEDQVIYLREQLSEKLNNTSSFKIFSEVIKDIVTDIRLDK